MRTSHVSLPILALAAVASLTPGCFGNDPLGLEGDWSRGERNNTQWQLGDGLCPGLAGGCALDVPLAVGLETQLRVEGVSSAMPTVNTPSNTAGVSIRPDAENQQATISFATTAAGSARFLISDERGEVDAATVQIRQATRIECGVLRGGGEPNWAMAGLTFSETNTVPLEPATSTAVMNSLACRTSDSTGPLLSANAIRWTIIEGTAVTLNDHDFDPTTIRGAHIDYTTRERGTVQVRATLGELSDTFNLTVE